MVGRMALASAVVGLMALSPAASASKIGAGAVLAAGDIYDDPVLGLQLGAYVGLPAVKRLAIGADATYYLVDYVTLITLEPNVHFDLVQTPVADVYAIGGANVVYAHADVFGYQETHVDVGLLLGAGAEVKAGPIHPFVDLKAALHGNPYFAASGGVRLAF
ncbi:MAG: hypothetical protein R3F59_14300 [Myxococcota bacterium]